jgi:uncharacterized protein (DUF697 family)
VAKLPLAPLTLVRLVRELRTATRDERPLAVGGARELAAVLARELARGGRRTAVSERLAGAAALVYVLAREPADEDEATLREAHRARIPIVCVLTGRVAENLSIPYVLATDVVRVPPGPGFPLEAIARALAAKLDERAVPLAARLPVLRPAVTAHLIESFARKNGLLGAASFIPGADLPVLTLNQVRLVLLIAAAHDQQIEQERLPELLAVLGGGVGLRALAREVLGVVPVAGWALKGAIAYAGTRAIGEAAARRFASRAAV